VEKPGDSGGRVQDRLFVGLATLGMKFLGSGTSLILYSRNAFSFTVSRILMLLILVSPFLVLIETGLAGYRGFSSWFRYFCLILSAAGTLGLIASFIVHRVMRR